MQVEISLGDVLAFFTGSDKISLLGFPNKAVMQFTQSGIYPTASTCSITLTLPTTHEDFSAFASHFIEAVRGHNGFGKV